MGEAKSHAINEKFLRDHLMVSLMVLQGCRQIELNRLNVGDIIKRGDQVWIKLSISYQNY